MLDSLTQFLTETTEIHGLIGDRTLEYIGLVLQNGTLTSKKVYYLAEKPNRDDDERLRNIWNMYFRELSDNYKAELCDFSEDGNVSFPSFRTIVRFREKLTKLQLYSMSDKYLRSVPNRMREHFLADADRLQELLRNDYSPLMQFGVEVDSQNEIIGIKYYLNLELPRRNSSTNSQLLEPIIFGLFNKSADTIDTMSLSEQLMKCSYSPVFVGVNEKISDREYKLYFISDIFGRSIISEAEKQLIDLCNVLKVEPKLRDILRTALATHGLYPQGVALSANERCTIRLYLKELSHTNGK